MRSIGEVMKDRYGDWEAKFEAARRHIDKQAQDMREAYGEDFDIEQCWHCGGRGVLPGNRGVCDKCDTGLILQGADDDQRKWSLTIPARFHEYRFATHPNRKVSHQVLDWFQEGLPQGENLYLGGPVGTGKTGMAIAALWAAHQGNRSILYTTVADMLHKLRPMDPNEKCNPFTMSELQQTHLLLLDDLGAEKASDWAREQLLMVLNGRYQNGLPTIVTSNFTPEELENKERVGGRAISRLTERVQIIWMDGDDLRQRRNV